MARINQYKKVASNACTAFVAAASISKQPPIEIPTNEKFVNFYKNEMQYLQHLRFEFFALKNWSNGRFRRVAGQWNKFNRRLFTQWQKYREITKLIFFLDAIKTTGAINEPTDEWAEPGLRAIDHFRKRIADLKSFCVSYQSLLEGPTFSADIQFLQDMKARLALDLNVLRPEATSDEAWDSYWKQSTELHKKIAKNTEHYRIRTIYSENRYVSEYQDVYYFPKDTPWWQKVIEINFGKPAYQQRVRPKREPITIFTVLGTIGTYYIAYFLPAAAQPTDNQIKKRVIEAQTELSNLVYVGSKKPAYFIYKYIGQWQFLLSRLQEALVDTNKHLKKLVKVYPEKLQDIDTTLLNIKTILQTKGVLTSLQASILQGHITSLKDNWDFDLVLPALSIQGDDRIGCLQVVDPEWHILEEGVDSLVPS